MPLQIGLIDVDGHHYPNIPLMKLSAYHKRLGDNVEWHREDGMYDIVYMSKVFSDAYTEDIPEPTNARKVIKGGTGYAIWLESEEGRNLEVYHKEKDPPLSDDIEHIYPDYSIYPEYTGYGQPLRKQTAYGFLSRGCPRKCDFCHVSPKEGCRAYKVADLSEFWRGQGTVHVYDPNILACKDAPDLLRQCAETGAKINFNQGIDARLIAPQIADTLANMRLHLPHFAMDNLHDMEQVRRGLRLYVDACKRTKGKWNWRYAKVYLLTNYNTTFEQDLMRIQAIQSCECWPFVMIYNRPSAPAIAKRLQRWTNNAYLYSTAKTFDDFQKYNYKSVLTSASPTEESICT